MLNFEYKLFWDFSVNVHMVDVKHKLMSFAGTKVLLS